MQSKILDWFGFGSQDIAAQGAHGHRHDGPGGHGHTHGVIDPSLTTSDKGIWAIKWSFVILGITAALQFVVVLMSGSVALLADSIHNIGDATTAIPLWAAFVLARRKPSRTFTYGLGRSEDLAGILIVLIILFSAIVAAYQAFNRLVHPQTVVHLGWLAAAGVLGFVGNETVAVFRIRVGRQMNSAALIADGYHARTDGLTSLAVVVGAVGVWLGFPLADPIIGLLITIAIFGIVWQSARAVITRTLDGVDPSITEEIRHAAEHVSGIARVSEAKARWIGHLLHADVAIATDEGQTLADANKIAETLRQTLFDHLPALRTVTVTFESLGQASGDLSPILPHHAPDPFRFQGQLATGVLEIVETADGERMRLTLSPDIPGLTGEVVIHRPGDQTETLELHRIGEPNGVLQSAVAPAEPHEFSAELNLGLAGQSESLTFRMSEPVGHSH